MKKPKKAPSTPTSLDYVRPQTGSFTLNAFPNRVFKFRKITLDDEAWVIANFAGRELWQLVLQPRETSQELCRLYFHFLQDEDKALFTPREVEEMDYEHGGKKTVLWNGPKLFMKSIDGGSVTELMLIGDAFLQTLTASRPHTDLPNHLKKKIEELAAKGMKQMENQLKPGKKEPSLTETSK